MLYKIPKQKPRLSQDDMAFVVIGFTLVFIKLGLAIAFLFK